MPRFPRPGTISKTLILVLLTVAFSSSRAGTVRQLTDLRTTTAGPGALNDAGTVVYAGSSGNPSGANARHSFQIFRFDPATGAPTQVTTAPDGVSPLVSVSDDGQWIAFPSPTDLTGQNHDESVELFVMASSGASIQQLTSDPAPIAGSVSSVALAGGGSRIVFLSDCDYLGTNPAHDSQMFVINRDGTGLRQLTTFTTAGIGAISISDDGARIVFSSDANPSGGNADLGSEVFAINADGTGLRQLTTTPATFDSAAPSLSGNGAKIAFQSNGNLTGGNAINQQEVFAINWDGTGLLQLTHTARLLGLLGDPASQSPSITDDGLIVVFYSNHASLFPFINLDGNYEIFRVTTAGTNLKALTNTLVTTNNFLPTIAGGGGRIVYYELATGISLRSMDGTGGTQRTLQAMDLVFVGGLDLTPDGSRAVFARATGLFSSSQLYRIQTDGTGLTQVTNHSSGSASSPSIAGDGQTIVFSADSDPLGGNADGSDEIFSIRADGTGIDQLTAGASGTACQDPALASAAPVIVFDADADLTGGNVDLSREIFRINLDGTGLVQLTNGVAGTTSDVPQVNSSGAWVAFESNADLNGGNADGSYEIFLARSDGTGLQRITGDAVNGSRAPDISASGDRIVFSSPADLLGTNPELNAEVYLYDVPAATLRQLTSFVKGSSGGARVSGDGQWVVFSSSAPIFEETPDDPSGLYRVSASGGAIERIGALRKGIGGVGPAGALGGGGAALVPDQTGRMTVFTGLGDFTEANPDYLSELWVIDRDALPPVTVSRTSPTVVSWTHESGPLRYDIVRGDVAFLGPGAPGFVTLGPVTCLENDSPDADTVGFGDPSDPPPGHAFFYVYRGTQGQLAGPGSYGTATDGAERTPSGGDCAPAF